MYKPDKPDILVMSLAALWATLPTNMPEGSAAGTLPEGPE